jgi:hypothetical protein
VLLRRVQNKGDGRGRPSYYQVNMTEQPVAGAFSLTGTVIEAFESDNQSILRLTITGGTVDVPVAPGEGAHLGETLRLEGVLRLKSMKAEPEHRASIEPLHHD